MLRSRLVGYMGAKAAGRLGRLGVRSILRLQSGGGAGNFSRADVLKLRRHFSAPPSKGDKEPHERKEQDSGELDDVPFVSSIHELPDVENLGKRDENHVSGAAPGPDDAREGGEKGGFGDPPWKTISVIGGVFIAIILALKLGNGNSLPSKLPKKLASNREPASSSHPPIKISAQPVILASEPISADQPVPKIEVDKAALDKNPPLKSEPATAIKVDPVVVEPVEVDPVVEAVKEAKEETKDDAEKTALVTQQEADVKDEDLSQLEKQRHATQDAQEALQQSKELAHTQRQLDELEDVDSEAVEAFDREKETARQEKQRADEERVRQLELDEWAAKLETLAVQRLEDNRSSRRKKFREALQEDARTAAELASLSGVSLELSVREYLEAQQASQQSSLQAAQINTTAANRLKFGFDKDNEDALVSFVLSFAGQLKQQKQEFDRALAEARKSAEKIFHDDLQQETRRLHRNHIKDLETAVSQAVAARDQHWQEVLDAKLESSRESHIRQNNLAREEWRSQAEAWQASVHSQYKSHLEKTETIHNQTVSSYSKMLQEYEKIETLSKHFQDLRAALADVELEVSQSPSFDTSWPELRGAADGDEIMQLVIQSIPVRKEVKSLREIQRTFGPVEKAAIKMSFLPHQSSKDGRPTVFEHMVANIFGFMSLQDRSLSSGDDDRSRLNRIGYHVDKGDLFAASIESDKLSGAEVRSVVRDWLAECKEYVALKQTLRVARAHVDALEGTLTRQDA